MRELQLNDAFDQVFKNKLKVDKSIVLETYRNPQKRQELENGVSLFLKDFEDDHLSHLLLATQEVNNQVHFAFCYWIPKKFISHEISLIDVLEIFANNFGCRIKILNHEGYFIKKARRLIHGKLESPDQIVEILGSVHIPCEAYSFFKENNGYNINWVDCYYCFAINNNKYLAWLNKIETVLIEVKMEWYSYLCEIRDMLNPNGMTGLTVLKGRKDNGDGLISFKDEQISGEKRVELEIPKAYVKPFTRINSIISRMEKGQKIAVIPRYKNDRCIFCKEFNTNREHIFPIWIRNYFKEETIRGTLITRLPEEDLLSSIKSGVLKKPESSYGYTTHQVCIDCNETWMSRLEIKAKSILAIDSTNLKKTIEELNLDEDKSKQLALWVTVKAILLSIKSYLTPSLPDSVFNELKRGTISSGFLIEIAEFELYGLNFIANRGAYNLLRLKKMDRKVAEKLSNNFFMVCVQFGHFVFRVSYIDETKGLKREGCIKPTNVLFPRKYNLPYYKIANEKEYWDQIDDKLKFNIFNIGLSLIDA